MRRLFALVVVSLLAVVLPSPTAAHASEVNAVISGVVDGTADVSPDPIQAKQGDTVKFKNTTLSNTPYTVCLETNDSPLVSVPPGGSASTPPLAESTIYYYLSNTDCSADKAFLGTIIVGPAPTTTAPPTTAAPTTAPPATTSTTAASTTTSSTTSSTTTSSTTTSTTTPVTVSTNDSGGGSGWALPLGIGALIVAALAVWAYFLWRRGQEPPFEEPPGWDEPPGPDDPTVYGDPPPTTQGPTV